MLFLNSLNFILHSILVFRLSDQVQESPCQSNQFNENNIIYPYFAYPYCSHTYYIHPNYSTTYSISTPSSIFSPANPFFFITLHYFLSPQPASRYILDIYFIYIRNVDTSTYHTFSRYFAVYYSKYFLQESCTPNVFSPNYRSLIFGYVYSRILFKYSQISLPNFCPSTSWDRFVFLVSSRIYDSVYVLFVLITSFVGAPCGKNYLFAMSTSGHRNTIWPCCNNYSTSKASSKYWSLVAID